MSLSVMQPGILSLLQDGGRLGQHRIGLTNGGPLDGEAFYYCNRLLGNAEGSTALEVSFGGLHLQAEVDTFICVTGACMPLRINSQERPLWEVHRINAGDMINLDFAAQGCRAYLGVADGFAIPTSFGSTATVMREGIGGLRGDKLHSGDVLPCATVSNRHKYYLPPDRQPHYQNTVTVRVSWLMVLFKDLKEGT